MTRWQDPKIQRRDDVARPFYYIRPFVPIVTADGVVRRQQRIQLGFCDEMRPRQAQAAKQEIMATINNGRMVLQSQIPFGAVLTQYLESHVPKLGSATQAKYRIHIRNHIQPVFQSMRMCDIDRPMVEAWLNTKMETLGWWARTDLRNILSAIFTWAAQAKKWAGDNPCVGVNVGRKSEKREKRIPNAKDLSAFIDALPETAICTAAEARLMVLTAVLAGARVSEVLGLQPRDINEETETIQIQRRWHRGDLDIPKSEESKRTRQVGGLASDLLRLGTGRGSDEFLFGRDGGIPPDDRDLQQHVFRPAAEAVGIYHEGFGMHTFRRLNITWRQQAGATPFEAMKAAGHSKPQTTWIYSITDIDREKKQVKRMYARLA